jgi:hypothetical protein
MTFCNITDKGILYLSNIQKIHFLSCKKIKCKDYDKLLKLYNIDLCHISLNDNDLIFLKNIKSLSIYGCDINGNGFGHLLNIENLSIYECPIIDEHLNHLLEFKNIKTINIFRCRLISRLKKNELKVIFSDKFNTDSVY